MAREVNNQAHRGGVGQHRIREELATEAPLPGASFAGSSPADALFK